MRNRLPPISTVIIIYLVTVFVGTGTMWLLEDKLGLSEWLTVVITLVVLAISSEFVSRLIPKAPDAPISHFLKLSKRDKVVFLVGPLVLFIIVLIGKSLHSGSAGVNLLFLVSGFLAWGLINHFFGSPELTGKPSKDYDKT